MSTIGYIHEITRYPVKSLAGESLESCHLDRSGLYGDRYCAFHDETRHGWERFVTARTIPNMLGYKARFHQDAIHVTAPDGQTYTWNEELLQEIQRYSNKELTLSSYKAPNPRNPLLMSVDQGSILIITDASIRKLEKMWGKKIDKRRFRANLLLSVDDTHIEQDWIGKQLVVGDARLEVVASCQRCSLITIDPDTFERDSSLLQLVYEEWDACFGVYASVIQTGTLRVGQSVCISDGLA